MNFWNTHNPTIEIDHTKNGPGLRHWYYYPCGAVVTETFSFTRLTSLITQSKGRCFPAIPVGCPMIDRREPVPRPGRIECFRQAIRNNGPYTGYTVAIYQSTFAAAAELCRDRTMSQKLQYQKLPPTERLARSRLRYYYRFTLALPTHLFQKTKNNLKNTLECRGLLALLIFRLAIYTLSDK